MPLIKSSQVDGFAGYAALSDGIWEDLGFPLSIGRNSGARPPRWGRFSYAGVPINGAIAFTLANAHRVLIADAADLDGMADLTVACWVYPTVVNTQQYLIDKENAYTLEIRATGRIRFTVTRAAGGTVLVDAPAGTISAGVWSRIVATYDGEIARVWVNGVIVATAAGAAASNVAATATALYLGGRVAANPYGGRMDEVLILATAWGSAEVLGDYNDGAGWAYAAGEAGLVAGYHLDEAVGSLTAADFTGLGHTGTLAGTVGIPVFAAGSGIVVAGITAEVWANFFETGKRQEVHFDKQIPHKWQIGSELRLHLHYTPMAAGTFVVGLSLLISTHPATGIWPAGPTGYTVAVVVAPGDVGKPRIVAIGTYVTGGGLASISSQVVARLYRDGADPADTLAGDVVFHEWDIHYRADDFIGSVSEYGKDA